jgi:hypothetical protein
MKATYPSTYDPQEPERFWEKEGVLICDYEKDRTFYYVSIRNPDNKLFSLMRTPSFDFAQAFQDIIIQTEVPAICQKLFAGTATKEDMDYVKEIYTSVKTHPLYDRTSQKHKYYRVEITE